MRKEIEKDIVVIVTLEVQMHVQKKWKFSFFFPKISQKRENNIKIDSPSWLRFVDVQRVYVTIVPINTNLYLCWHVRNWAWSIRKFHFFHATKYASIWKHEWANEEVSIKISKQRFTWYWSSCIDPQLNL